jgi:hypothetical protein
LFGTFAIRAWAAAMAFIVFGFILLKFAKTLRPLD